MAYGRVVALDLGEKRIGVAVSDSNRTLAMPWAIIERQPSYKATYENIRKSLEDIEISLVVVGMPLSLDGKEHRAAENVHSETENLVKLFNADWLFWDERNSSKQVTSLLYQVREKPEQITDQPKADKQKPVAKYSRYMKSAKSQNSEDPSSKNISRWQDATSEGLLPDSGSYELFPVGKPHSKFRKKVQRIDDKAAAIILQSYLDATRESDS